MSQKFDKGSLSRPEPIEDLIHSLRGERVILDTDLARIYGVATKVLNQAVGRNLHRFPKDFAFRLTAEEAARMRSQFVTASKRNIRYQPYAFTEYGAFMAANVLNSERAVAMSIYVIRAFVRMRQTLVANEILQRRLAEIERTLLNHDTALRDLYEKIRPLLLPSPEPPKRQIGFRGD
jgi:hypothetical protein